ncbi:hypothetical protein LX32DRAFT_172760 [Colletotrichum zoysiae]|uniref:Secreted protein n=1 Tax=Colletotrichum zoysiae TaxID=1216348 RepID=A0AAD9H5R1_9PEZI|nr:hypothetical protein LX32DRAFT_172760 [Colletotrichum zoysiae]
MTASKGGEILPLALCFVTAAFSCHTHHRPSFHPRAQGATLHAVCRSSPREINKKEEKKRGKKAIKGEPGQVGERYEVQTTTCASSTACTSTSSPLDSTFKQVARVDIAIQQTNDERKTANDAKFQTAHVNRLGFTYTESMSNEIHQRAPRLPFKCLAAGAGTTRHPCHRVPLTYTVEGGFRRRRHIGHPVRPPVSGCYALSRRWSPGGLEVTRSTSRDAPMVRASRTLDVRGNRL